MGLLLSFQVDINLDNPVGFGFMTGTVQRTFTTVNGLVQLGALCKACRSPANLVANVSNLLTHGRDIMVTLGIVVKFVDAEWVFILEASILPLVKQTIIHVGRDFLLFQKREFSSDP